MKTKMMKMKNGIVMMVLALTVACSAMTFSVPVHAISADAIPNGTPVVDGVMEDMWNNASNKIVIDIVNSGTTTLTGYARMMWDSQYLYVLGYVNDPTLATVENGETYWATDSFEIFLDEANAHSTVKNDIAQIRVSRQGALSGMLMSKVAGKDTVLATFPKMKWAAKNTGTAGNYIVETAIPWTKATGAAGTQIGIEFQINDMKSNTTAGGADALVNSEVIDTWTCATYRMMTLSATKAAGGNSGTASGGNNGTTSGGNNSTTPGGNNSTTPGGNNSTTPGGNNSTNPDGNNSTTPEDNNGTTLDGNETMTPDDNKNMTSENDGTDTKKDTAADKKYDANDDNSSDSGLLLPLIIVGVVVLLVIGGCVAVIIISKKRK
ncbi:MAG: hypothetical protein IJE60_05470 [Tyzzerella sp.]|nr:hypothetical protein [Tyzzerella sp.]